MLKIKPRHGFLTYLSPAKLNLGLKIVGKRNDGYHLLKTIFCLINLYDEVNLQTTRDGKISLIEHNQAWSYQKDLAYKAAKLLQEKTQTTFGVNIKIKKTIPSGAGLGGGSSNAATVLIALNQLWETNLSNLELINIGKELGADVPFFIYGTNAVATGIGEQLETIKIPQQYFVLIQPQFHLATRDVFTRLEFKIDNLDVEKLKIEYLLKHKENDLAKPAIAIEPQLKTILNELQQYGNAVMTGSGSVVFLSYKDKNTAKKVAQELRIRYNTYLVKSLKLSPLYTKSF